MKLFNLFLKKNTIIKTGDPVVDFYNNYDEDSRLAKKSRCPEYLTTMKYIEKYLKPDSKIIEIGAGTGRYSVTLASKGYEVTAVDLVEHNIDIMKKKVKPHHKIEIHQGNACDLSFIESNKYDMVLLLGPMYHLFNGEDKHKALSEAIRVAKKGGVIYSAYVNNDTTVYSYFNKREILNWVNQGVLTNTYHFKSIPKEVIELYRKSDIDELMKNYNVTRLHYVGTDMLSNFLGFSVDNLNYREFEEYMKFMSNICEREDCVGLSSHTLDIFRKEDS